MLPLCKLVVATELVVVVPAYMNYIWGGTNIKENVIENSLSQ